MKIVLFVLQVVIDQLRGKLCEAEQSKSELEMIKQRETTLEKEVQDLLLELKDARDSQSPVCVNHL